MDDTKRSSTRLTGETEGFSEAFELYWDDDGSLSISGGEYGLRLDAESRKTLAIRSLHRQPFGFTREDVAWHRGSATLLEASLRIHRLSTVPGGDGVRIIEAERDWHSSMADRIEALFPPEDEE